MLFRVGGFDPAKEYHAKIKREFLAASGADEWTVPWPLPNAKQVEEKLFWGWRASQGFLAEAWAGQKQVGKEWATLLVYFLNHGHYIGGGFAVLVFRRYCKERVEYYGWRACDHEFSAKNIGNCLTRYTCTKCGASHDVDSSG